MLDFAFETKTVVNRICEAGMLALAILPLSAVVFFGL
jgi:hypothetical protein